MTGQNRMILLISAAAITVWWDAPVGAEPANNPVMSTVCRAEDEMVRPPDRQVPAVVGVGALKRLQAKYSGGGRLRPYENAVVEGERLGPTSVQRAEMEGKFLIAQMALDAGFRWFEPNVSLMWRRSKPGDDALIQGLVDLTGIRNKRVFWISATFCDARSERANDALEAYNRYGNELLGAKFTPRTAPAPTKLLPPLPTAQAF